MTDFAEIPGNAAEFDDEGTDDPVEILRWVCEAQEALGRQMDEMLAGLNRVAGNLNPLLTEQYQNTQSRIRQLELRIRNRQERPLINRMADLLSAVRRLDSGADIKTHVEEALLDALASYGYEETGTVGERFDPARHEPVAGSVGKAGVVATVHQRGLACSGDVIKKALVNVAPAAKAGPEPVQGPADRDGVTGGWPGPAARDAGSPPGAQSEQGAIPA